MDFYAIAGIVVVILLAAIFGITTKYYNYIRSDAGYNVGRNHMMDEYGFTDDELRQGKDDDDSDMYVFREKNHKKK